jgi:[FeFe] hydrogenase H-cluster radical SAM maturase HydG
MLPPALSAARLGLSARVLSVARAAAPTLSPLRAFSSATPAPAVAGLRTPARTYYSAGSAWSPERDPDAETAGKEDIIDPAAIAAALEVGRRQSEDPVLVRAILTRARDNALLKTPESCSGTDEYMQLLTLEDSATLLCLDGQRHPELLQLLFDTAKEIKKHIYGDRVVLFAPLYIANHCVNGCTYCSFCAANEETERCSLSNAEVAAEVRALTRLGHKRVLALTGESPKYSFDQFLEAVKVIAATKSEKSGEVRRINVEIPSVSVSDYKRLKATGVVGSIALFQETYDEDMYAKYHPTGPKADFENRLTTFDRAMKAGCDDVGLGVLYGLTDHRWDTLAMLQHAAHLDKAFAVGPHTLSVPRLQPAAGAETSQNIPFPLGDDDFAQVVATLRLSVPYTGIILSTRETPEIRERLLALGVSQLSAGSRVDIGSYERDDEVERAALGAEKATHQSDGGAQFELSDHRTPDEIIRWLLEQGSVPSFCTACYRLGRTGEEFMKWAKQAGIGDLCGPNACLTLAEYALDYASPATAELAWEVIERETEKVKSPARRKALVHRLERIRQGERDLYF